MTQTLLTSNVVRVVNEGTTDFVGRYGPNARLVVRAGAEVFVDQEVMWHFVGRWWMDNSDPRLKERVEEFKRLRVFYGAYDDSLLWERVKPRLAVYTTDTHEQITTVVDDPDGAAFGKDELALNLGVEDRLEKMQGEIRRLQSELDQRDRTRQAEESPTPQTDGPIAVPSPVPATPGPRTREVAELAVPVAPGPVDAPEGAADLGVPDDSDLGGVDSDLDGAPARLPVHAEVIEPPEEPPERGAEAPPDMPTRTRVGGSE